VSSALEGLLTRARGGRHHVALIGGEDDRLSEIAGRLEQSGVGQVTLIGGDGLVPSGDARLSEVAGHLRDRWPERVRDGIHALDLAADPLLFGAGLLLAGEADVLLAASGVPDDLVEDAFRWLLGPERERKGRGWMTYILAGPERLITTATPDTAGPLDAAGVAQLALAAANHRRQAVADTPRVGFLVASPTQDASHADAEVALAEFKAIAPGIQASVEWAWAQGDGRATGRFRAGPNILIFPDPVSGHLAHEFLRDAAGSRVIGPLFPGDRWAVVGLGAGTEADDIVAVASVAAAGLRGA